MKDKKTNEEKRELFYEEGVLPTDPTSVTGATALDTLNLNWTERDLPEHKRTKHVHRLHPYLGKYIPQLVEIFLRKYFQPGQTVLDPFVGSGTTLVQANELGIHAVGSDISAFNTLICRAKTTCYDLVQVRKEVMDILDQTQRLTQHTFSDLPLFHHMSFSEPQVKTDSEYLQKWFAPRALFELLTYRDAIDRSDYVYKDLMRVILSRAARSARLTTHFDLDFPKKPQTEPYYCYKHARVCSPTDEAFKFIKRYSLDSLKRIEEFAALHTDARVTIYHADSREVTYPSIDGVITSPPYVGLIDYHEQHAYAYHLLGLQDNRAMEIGPAAGGSSRKAQKQYQIDIGATFQRALDSMPIGGRLIIVAGDRANLYGEIAEIVGVEVENIIERHVNRRTGRRSNEFYESVFIWRKR